MSATTKTTEYVQVCINVRGGWYLAFAGHKGRPASKGPQACQASPVFLTREEAINYGTARGWTILGV